MQPGPTRMMNKSLNNGLTVINELTFEDRSGVNTPYREVEEDLEEQDHVPNFAEFLDGKYDQKPNSQNLEIENTGRSIILDETITD